MEILKHILFLYSFFGILVAGGLIFNKSNQANLFLAIFTLAFSIGQLNFIYDSTNLISYYPQYSTLTLSTWLIYGPSLWFYIKHFNLSKKIKWREIIIHLIPFMIYFVFSIYLFTFSPHKRISYLHNNFIEIIMPFNYGIAIHISIYAVMMILFVKKYKKKWGIEKIIYTNTIVGVYILTAVIQSYLTIFAKTYQWFIYYFLFTSSIVFFVAYILYFKPKILKNISKKYYSSGLDKEGKKRIINKIRIFLSNHKNCIDPSLDLSSLCNNIGEKTHHVSQTISEELKTTFKDLINKNRIEYAKLLLSNQKNKNSKIFAIALDSGFTNKSTFHRAFIKFTDSTPSEFRKKNVI